MLRISMSNDDQFDCTNDVTFSDLLEAMNRPFFIVSVQDKDGTPYFVVLHTSQISSIAEKGEDQ